MRDQQGRCWDSHQPGRRPGELYKPHGLAALSVGHCIPNVGVHGWVIEDFGKAEKQKGNGSREERSQTGQEQAGKRAKKEARFHCAAAPLPLAQWTEHGRGDAGCHAKRNESASSLEGSAQTPGDAGQKWVDDAVCSIERRACQKNGWELSSKFVFDLHVANDASRYGKRHSFEQSGT